MELESKMKTYEIIDKLQNQIDIGIDMIGSLPNREERESIAIIISKYAETILSLQKAVDNKD
jgi:predicted HTH domain antitoxin